MLQYTKGLKKISAFYFIPSHYPLMDTSLELSYTVLYDRSQLFVIDSSVLNSPVNINYIEGIKLPTGGEGRKIYTHNLLRLFNAAGLKLAIPVTSLPVTKVLIS